MPINKQKIIVIIGAALCCTLSTSFGQSFISKSGFECLFISDFPCEDSEIYPGFCDIIPNLVCPTCPQTVAIRGANIFEGSALAFSERVDTMFTISTWFFTEYDMANERGEHIFSPSLRDSRIQIQDHVQGLLPYQNKFYVTTPFRYGIFDPRTDELDTRLYDLEDQGQTALVRYKDELIGIKTSEVDQNTGRLISNEHRHVLYKYDIDNFLANPEKIIELDHSFKVGSIINGQKLTTAQIHCEDVRLYYNGPRLYYFYPDSSTVFEECDNFLFIDDNSIIATDFPKWCDCELSIDLDLDDEPIQFNRDFTYTADCHTDLHIVDEDVQVFASVGAIDSITIRLRDGDSSQFLITSSSSVSEILVSGNQSHEITLVNNGTASFDNYEDVMKTILYVDTDENVTGDLVIEFQAHFLDMMSTISSTRISIPDVAVVNSIDTTIMTCLDVALDASQFLIDTIGLWYNGDSIYDPMIDGPEKQLLYFHENICEPDTSVIVFTAEPAAVEQDLIHRICHDDSLNISGEWFYQDTILRDTIFSILGGCDSVYQTRILEFGLAASVSVEDITVCNGDSLLIGQQYIKESNQIMDTTSNMMGCDSLISIIAVTVTSPADSLKEDLSLCKGDSLMIGNEYIGSAGEYESSLYSIATGCDSIITTHNVVVVEAIEVREQTGICYGDSVQIGAAWVINSGVYLDTIQDRMSCDSLIREVSLTVSSTPTSIQIDTILCDRIVIDDMTILEPGIYVDTLPNVQGCDSLYINYHVEEGESLVINEEQTYMGEVGEEVLLDIMVSGETTVTWYPSDYLSCTTCISPTILAGHPDFQSYEVMITNQDLCQESIVLNLRLSELSEIAPSNEYYIPNILSFSSEVNKTFYVQGDNQSDATYDMVIYDRWGGIVYQELGAEINNESHGWDITMSRVNTGVYVYVIAIGEELISGSLTIFK